MGTLAYHTKNSQPKRIAHHAGPLRSVVVCRAVHRSGWGLPTALRSSTRSGPGETGGATVP